MRRGELIRELEAMAARCTAIANELRESRPRNAENGASEGEDPAAPDRDEAGLFRGRSISAKYAGRCVVCSEGFEAGAQVIFGQKSRKCAHVGCGAIEPRGGRT